MICISEYHSMYISYIQHAIHDITVTKLNFGEPLDSERENGNTVVAIILITGVVHPCIKKKHNPRRISASGGHTGQSPLGRVLSFQPFAGIRKPPSKGKQRGLRVRTVRAKFRIS